MSGTISFSPGGAENTSTAVTGLPTGKTLDDVLIKVAPDPGIETVQELNNNLIQVAPDIALETWDINFTAQTITLNLLAAGDASTLDVTKITLQNAATSTLEYTLVDSTTSSADGVQIVIDMGALDSAALSGTPGLTTNSGNSYMRIAADAILGLAYADSIATISDGHAKQVTTFTS